MSETSFMRTVLFEKPNLPRKKKKQNEWNFYSMFSLVFLEKNSLQ